MNRTSKRRISVIQQLFHGRPLRQKDIMHKINHDGFLEGEEKVDEGKLSHVLKSLDVDEIIERKPVMLEGKGAPQMVSRLQRTPEALIKILREFYNPDLEKAGYFQRRLIISHYAQQLIDIELLNYIEFNICKLFNAKLDVKHFHFNDHQREILLKILRTSPSALHFATVNYDIAIDKIIQNYKRQLDIVDGSNIDELKNDIISKIIKNFYLNLQLKLGEDITKNIVKYNCPIEYRISFKFLDDIEEGQWELHCENNEIATIFLRDTYI